MKNIAAVFILALGFFGSGLIGLGQAKPKLVFLDIGQGDAIYIRTPAGQDILVDSGPSYQVVNQLAEQLPHGDHHIEMIIATHMDADHIGGFKDVLSAYQVGAAYYNGEQKDTVTAKKFLNALDQQALVPKALQQGTVFSSPGFSMTVLWPSDQTTEAQDLIASSSNEASVVLSINFEGQTILLTGDMPTTVEQYLLNTHVLTQHQYLQLPHHGSKNSSSINMLKIINPEQAFISVGKNNRYGHPASEVLQRLQDLELPVARTDQQGSLRVI